VHAQPVEPLPETPVDSSHSVPDLPAEVEAVHAQPVEPLPQQTETVQKVSELSVDSNLAQTSVPVVPSVTLAKNKDIQEPPSLPEDHQEVEQKIKVNQEPPKSQTKTLVPGYPAGESLAIFFLIPETEIAQSIGLWLTAETGVEVDPRGHVGQWNDQSSQPFDHSFISLPPTRLVQANRFAPHRLRFSALTLPPAL
jgi:hypothetical protein